MLIIFFVNCNGLKPFNSNFKKKRKFFSDKTSPANDLKVITPKEASVITRYWLSNIMVDNIINVEDESLVEKINKAEQYFQNQFTQFNTYNDLFLAWAPQGNVKEICFIVFSTVNHIDKRLIVNLLISNPNWDSIQISTLELKNALEDLTTKSNAYLDLDLLYKDDLRIKYDWTIS